MKLLNEYYVVPLLYICFSYLIFKIYSLKQKFFDSYGKLNNVFYNFLFFIFIFSQVFVSEGNIILEISYNVLIMMVYVNFLLQKDVSKFIISALILLHLTVFFTYLYFLKKTDDDGLSAIPSANLIYFLSAIYFLLSYFLKEEFQQIKQIYIIIASFLYIIDIFNNNFILNYINVFYSYFSNSLFLISMIGFVYLAFVKEQMYVLPILFLLLLFHETFLPNNTNSVTTYLFYLLNILMIVYTLYFLKNISYIDFSNLNFMKPKSGQLAQHY